MQIRVQKDPKVYFQRLFQGSRQFYGYRYTSTTKKGVIHILNSEKIGPFIYFPSWQKGAIRAAHPYYPL